MRTLGLLIAAFGLFLVLSAHVMAGDNASKVYVPDPPSGEHLASGSAAVAWVLSFVAAFVFVAGLKLAFPVST